MVGGRYLATFSSNCFGINGNQVAELVATAILVAALSRHAGKNWAIPENALNSSRSA